jgi:hypothetical protein
MGYTIKIFYYRIFVSKHGISHTMKGPIQSKTAQQIITLKLPTFLIDALCLLYRINKQESYIDRQVTMFLEFPFIFICL